MKHTLCKLRNVLQQNYSTFEIFGATGLHLAIIKILDNLIAEYEPPQWRYYCESFQMTPLQLMSWLDLHHPEWDIVNFQYNLNTNHTEVYRREQIK